jgi:hypothetical protein
MRQHLWTDPQNGAAVEALAAGLHTREPVNYQDAMTVIERARTHG